MLVDVDFGGSVDAREFGIGPEPAVTRSGYVFEGAKSQATVDVDTPYIFQCRNHLRAEYALFGKSDGVRDAGDQVGRLQVGSFVAVLPGVQGHEADRKVTGLVGCGFGFAVQIHRGRWIQNDGFDAALLVNVHAFFTAGSRVLEFV